MGIEDEKADQILEIHQSVLSEIKSERDSLKNSASKVEELEKALEKANKELETANSDAYKDKYDGLKKEFDDYKADIEAKALTASKDKAYREILKEAGVSEKRIDAVMKLTDLKEVELDGDKLKDADKLKESIKTEWADFIVVDGKEGAGTDNPPAGGSGKPDLESLSMEDYIKARKN